MKLNITRSGLHRNLQSAIRNMAILIAAAPLEILASHRTA
jgi:hypothetical protein